MIKFEHVGFAFKDGEVLHDVDFEIHDGEFVGIIGANGAGKTTLIRLLLGLLKPTTGKITSEEKSISYVSQTTSLSDSSFPCTVEEVVESGLTKIKPGLFQIKERKQKAEQVLKEFDLYDIRKKLVSEISGGQQQRVKIAKAVISSPSLIVLDEPDAGMDHESHDKLIELLENEHKQKGKGIVFISHHLHDLANADAIYQVRGGTVKLFEGEDEHHVAL